MHFFLFNCSVWFHDMNIGQRMGFSVSVDGHISSLRLLLIKFQLILL